MLRIHVVSVAHCFTSVSQSNCVFAFPEITPPSLTYYFLKLSLVTMSGKFETLQLLKSNPAHVVCRDFIRLHIGIF